MIWKKIAESVAIILVFARSPKPYDLPFAFRREALEIGVLVVYRRFSQGSQDQPRDVFLVFCTNP